MTPNPAPPAAPPPAPPPENKNRTVLKWVAIVLGVPLAILLLLVATFVLFEKTQTKTALAPADRVAVLTVEDLSAVGGTFPVEPKSEVSSRTSSIDGSSVLTYEYESKKPAVYVATIVSLETSEVEAKASYLAQENGSAKDLGHMDPTVSLEERDELLKWGDQSHSRLITVDGKPVGNFFIARKNNRVFLTMFTGVYFDDPEDFRSVVEPKLEAMAALPR